MLLSVSAWRCVTVRNAWILAFEGLKNLILS